MEFKLTNPRAYLIVERFFLFFWQILRPISVVYSFNFFALKNLEVVAKAVCSIFNVWALALKNKRRIRRPGSLLVLHPKFTHWSRLKRKNSFYLWKCFIICIFFNGLVMLGSWFLKIVISLLCFLRLTERKSSGLFAIRWIFLKLDGEVLILLIADLIRFLKSSCEFWKGSMLSLEE